MANPPLQRKVQHRVTPQSSAKPNGKDGLDPKIIKMVEFLDRAIRTQDPTVGTVIAAVGVLLGRKVGTPDNLNRVVHDVTTAIRVGFYLHHSQGK